jgi:L-lactate dehydrogenase complex protein LldF
VYPGPIGAVLSPQLTGVAANASLPFASSLCGACYEVCPVAIDIPTMLVHLRSEAVDSARRRRLSPERSLMAAAAWTMADSERWTRALRAGRLGRLAARRRALPPPLSAWVAARDLPEPPRETFRDWWTREGQR